MKKHSWQRVSFFKHVCKKCGCVKEKKGISYPCEITYENDGRITKRACECDERLVSLKKEELVLMFS